MPGVVLNSIAAVLLLGKGSTIHLVRTEFIYESAPFPSCHAATIVQTASGKIMASWFSGTAESNPDVGIYLSELRGQKWTTPKEVAIGKAPNGERRPCYNPVLFQPSGGPLLLFYKVGTGPQTWWGMLMRSEDGGASWSTPERLPDGVLGPIKNKPMELLDHTLICPSSTEDHGWRVHFESTKDFGKTWSVGNPVNDGMSIGAIQPSLLRLSPNHLRAIGRTQQGYLFTVDSTDQGKTWGPMTLTDVFNPNSGCDAITLKDGRHLLVYNNTKTGRTPLNVALSEDGRTWTPLLTLENQPGEYSYPSVIQAQDGLVHVVYTWQRKRIKHAVVRVQ